MYPASGNSWGAYPGYQQEGYQDYQQDYYDNGYHAMGGYAGEEDEQYEDNQGGHGGQYALMQQQAFFTAIAQAQGAQTNATWYPDQYVDPYYEVAAVNRPAVAVTPGRW